MAKFGIGNFFSKIGNKLMLWKHQIKDKNKDTAINDSNVEKNINKKRRKLKLLLIVIFASQVYLTVPKLRNSGPNNFGDDSNVDSVEKVIYTPKVNYTFHSNDDKIKSKSIAKLLNFSSHRGGSDPLLPGSGFSSGPKPPASTSKSKGLFNFLPGVEGFQPKAPLPQKSSFKFGPKNSNSKFQLSPSGSGNPSGSGGNEPFNNFTNVKKDIPGYNPRYYSAQPKNTQTSRTKLKKKQLEQCELEEKRINRPGQKDKITVARRESENRNFYIEHDTIRLKIYHAKEFGLTPPPSFNSDHAKKLKETDLNAYKMYVRDKNILPDSFIEEVAKAYRDHIMDPNTQVIRGTINAIQRPKDRQDVIHFFNRKKEVNIFVGLNGRYQSGWRLNQKKVLEFLRTKNLM